MKRTPLVTRSRTAVASAAVAAAALAGCATMSPSTTTEPYDAADGVSAVLDESVMLQNMLVVGTGSGAPGVVLGSIINRGTRAATVSLMAAVPDGGNPAETRIRVPASGVVQLGDSPTPVVIEALPGEPGGVITISAQTTGGGSVDLAAPIVPQSGYYASYTAPASTPSATPTTPAPTGTAGGGQDEDAEGATPTPSESATS